MDMNQNLQLLKKNEISKKNILITNYIDIAINGGNLLHTDVWSSMGEESQKKKDKDFHVFSIDNNL